VHNKVVK
jgi:hypothetical protein